MSTVLYDAGALIAAERRNKRLLAMHETWLKSGFTAFVPTPVIAQAWRSPRQVGLTRVLNGCRAWPLDLEQALEVGKLLAASETSDVVDGAVVVAATRLRPIAVVTSDRDDLTHLGRTLRLPLPIVDV